jgi:hypothetical protein
MMWYLWIGSAHIQWSPNLCSGQMDSPFRQTLTVLGSSGHADDSAALSRVRPSPKSVSLVESL